MRCNPLFLFTIAIVKSEIQQKSNHKGDLIKAQNSIQSIKKLCGEVCKTQVDYLPQSGKYFPNIWKNFDCPQLFKHDWNQMGAEFSTPPKWTSLSFDIQKQLTWDGMFHLAIHYMNDNFQIPAKKWTQNMVEEFQRNFQDGTLFGNYGVDNVNRISKIIDDKMQLKDNGTFLNRNWISPRKLIPAQGKVFPRAVFTPRGSALQPRAKRGL